MAKIPGPDTFTGKVEPADKAVSRLIEAWNKTSIQFKRAVGASLAATGVATGLLMVGSGGETSAPSTGLATTPIEANVVNPGAITAETAPGCTAVDEAVAAYMGAQATRDFVAACSPTRFAPEILATNR